jgi:heat shock protein HslJ
MRIATVIAVLAALLAAGCGSREDSSGTSTGSASTSGSTTATTGAGTTTGTPAGTVTAAGLDGHTFISTAVRGHELVPGTKVTLSFDHGGLGAQAGCNSMGGAYAVEDGVLRWNAAPATTMIGCEERLQRQDEWLADFLSGGARVLLGGGTESAADDLPLTLTRDGVTIELAVGTPASQPPPIVETTWTLVRMLDRDGTVASVPAGVEPPTLRLTEGGTAEVFAGCNRGGGRAQLVEGAFVVFGPLALTRMACDPAAMRLERTVTSILHGRTALGFEGRAQTVANNGRHLVFRG